ncbi:unnamed protein product [Polarella glacialis]|uniref:Uncharacterized protein n=1 Tax=Polarella glacialis TaxID=89957 RepID=A0A813IGE7_POLGL|nr:unnamed protein product [Polarella glacialis]
MSAASKQDQSEPKESAGAAEHASFAAAFGRTLERFRWVEDPSREELAEELAESGARELYEAMGGLVLTPLSGPGGMLHSYWKMHLALGLVKQHELERGRPFDWIVLSRTDLIWVANHPPLSLMDAKAVWIPHTGRKHDSDGLDGLCDWHAAVPRGLAEVYFGRWLMLVQGVAPATPLHNPHVFLRNVLRVSGAPVGRFPAVAGLESCSHWSCFASWTRKDASNWRWSGERRWAGHRLRAWRSWQWHVGYNQVEVLGSG